MSGAFAEDAAFRYRPLVKLASGGMATVYIGALRGPSGFRQIVAIKRPHAHLLEDPELREEALAEARIAARIHHANVVDVRDVEVAGESIQLVMDYIEGVTLSALLASFARRNERIPAPIAARILLDACAGLTAVHELQDDAGRPLHLVHRDISPQNILVGIDGVARISDFGTVKDPASSRPLTTQGTLKGKPGYMAPEYVQRGAVDARSDELSLAVVAWESLVGKRLFRGATDFETFEKVLREEPTAPSAEVPGLGARFDEVLARALSKDPGGRYATVRDFAEAFARACGEVAPYQAVADLVNEVAGEDLRARRAELRLRLEALDAEAPVASAASGGAATASGATASGGAATASGGAAAANGATATANGGGATTSSGAAATEGVSARTQREIPSVGAPEARGATAVSLGPRRGRWIAVGLAVAGVATILVVGLARRGESDAPLGEPATVTLPSATAIATPVLVASTAATPPLPTSMVPSPTSEPAPAASPSVSARAPSKTAPTAPSASASAGKRPPRRPPPNPY